MLLNEVLTMGHEGASKGRVAQALPSALGVALPKMRRSYRGIPFPKGLVVAVQRLHTFDIWERRQ